MIASDFFNEHRVSGVLFILAFVSFAVGAGLPTVGEKGNMGIFTLPVREYLAAIAQNTSAWRWGNVFMGAAGVLLLVGLTLFDKVLEEANERTLSRLGLMAFLVAAVLWVIFSAFRATVTINAAQEMAGAGATSPVPGYYEPMAQWAYALFYAYAVLAYLALAAFGGSMLQAGLLAGWVGWVTVIFSVAMLALMLVTGDTLPAFHYLPPLLIGILLLFNS
jgi:hypothetical protein